MFCWPIPRYYKAWRNIVVCLHTHMHNLGCLKMLARCIVIVTVIAHAPRHLWGQCSPTVPNSKCEGMIKDERWHEMFQYNAQVHEHSRFPLPIFCNIARGIMPYIIRLWHRLYVKHSKLRLCCWGSRSDFDGRSESLTCCLHLIAYFKFAAKNHTRGWVYRFIEQVLFRGAVALNGHMLAKSRCHYSRNGHAYNLIFTYDVVLHLLSPTFEFKVLHT